MAEIKVIRRKITPAWVLPVVGLAAVAGIALIIGLTYNRGVDQTAAAKAGCSGDDDCPGHKLCADGICRDVQAGAAECAVAQVHFDTDSTEIRADDKGRVARMARCLKADQSMKLTIAANTDERGTAEHNSELGERRAMAVARALGAHGVSAAQIKVVSYGENRPLCGEDDSACWAKNRQASLVPRP